MISAKMIFNNYYLIINKKISVKSILKILENLLVTSYILYCLMILLGLYYTLKMHLHLIALFLGNHLL